MDPPWLTLLALSDRCNTAATGLTVSIEITECPELVAVIAYSPAPALDETSTVVVAVPALSDEIVAGLTVIPAAAHVEQE
jgi:hypothetical protein